MSTSLMPMDPALSPQQVSRLLPIRANLLPSEITAGRNARRMRNFVLVGVAVVLVGLGGWSADAYVGHSQAENDLAAVNTQIDQVNKTMHNKEHSDITNTIDANKTISDELKTLMANDLRWSTLLDKLRATGTASSVQISQITAALADTTAASADGTTTDTTTAAAATLTLDGSAKDKQTIAGFIKNLAQQPGIANPYLTSATQSTDPGTASTYSFTISADVTSKALCGRFTTPCPTGGK
jgi:iron uptake system EfeUOB component EfeO/EfeM